MDPGTSFHGDDEPDAVLHSREARHRAMREHASRQWKLERVTRVVNDFFALDVRRQRAVSPLAFAQMLRDALDSEPPEMP